MLTATNLDGATFHIRSRTAQHNITEDLTLQPKMVTVTSDITTVPDVPDTTQNHLSQTDYKHNYKCRELIFFVNAFPGIYQMAKHKHEADLFLHIKGLLYKHVMDTNQNFLVLVIPKAWKCTVVMEAHDKLGHQGATHTYCLIKCQYYWKGMNKDIIKYMAKLYSVLQGKGQGSILSSTNDQDTWVTFWQNNHRVGSWKCGHPLQATSISSPSSITS